ncbi:hypothetical protein Cal6303_0459 [Calothrix sp. PCC 6303]|nr:hypothetical protein Cal6303_0459 [Calothrix sp. PCC 6303]
MSMKTAEKLAAAWLMVLGSMFITLSVSASIEKNNIQKPISPIIDEEGLVRDFQNRDALYLLETTSRNGMIFGIPTLLLGGYMSFGLYSQSRQEKKALQKQTSDRLQSLFYQMVLENHGRVTLLGFAMQSELPANTAKEFLDERAKDFNANFKVSEDGIVSYYFDV